MILKQAFNYSGGQRFYFENKKDMEICSKLLKKHRNRKIACRLRHSIYTEELGWTDSEIEEIDHYDKGADFIGLLANGVLIGFLRVIPHTSLWMFENTFSHQLDTPLEKTSSSVEGSRYLIAKEYRHVKFKSGNLTLFLSSFLMKGLFQYCVQRKITQVYFLPRKSVYRLLRMQGFPVFPISKSYHEPDGVLCQPAIISWEKLILNFKRLDFIRWLINDNIQQKTEENTIVRT